MKTATQLQALNRRELSERIRQYHELMEPHIRAVAGAIGSCNRPALLMAGGELAERIYTPEERKLLDSLNELSEMYAERLGLATPSQAG